MQVYLGGSLLCGVVEGVGHYWNILPDSSELDLTQGQFGLDTLEPTEVESRERDYVLAFPVAEARYQLLRNRVEVRLDGSAAPDMSEENA